MLPTFTRMAPLTALATALSLGMVNGGEASTVAHPSAVSEIADTRTPHLAPDNGASPVVAYSITQTGETVVVGGNFTLVQNANRTVTYPRSNIMAFHAITGAITAFAPAFDGQIWSVLGDGDSVYVGGEFTTVNSVPRAAVAKLNLATGALDPTFQPTFTGGRVTDMALVHGQLIVGGTFQKKLICLEPGNGEAHQLYQCRD